MSAVQHVSACTVSVVDKAIGIGGGGMEFDSSGTKCRQRVATAVTFLQSCVGQALSRGDEPRHSLVALAYITVIMKI